MSNPMCHWELMVNDVAKAKQFYGAVFGWTFDDAKFPGYTIIETGKGVGGGLMAKPPQSPAPALNTYFEVAEVDKTLRQVVESGGTVVVPKTEIPGVGWFAMFVDPDRIAVGILQPSPAMQVAGERGPSWDDVRRIAKELDVQVHLAGMEARDRWAALQPRFAALEKTISEKGERAGQVVAKELVDLGKSLRKLFDDLVGPRS